MSENTRIIKLNPVDEVAIAKVTIPSGSVLEDAGGVRTVTEIPGGHKVALRKIQSGDPVHKYGQIIGFATQDIEPGQHVHVQNLSMGHDFERDYAFGKGVKPPLEVNEQLTFNGYLRPDGRGATRNLIGIVSTVNCSATTVKKIAEHFVRSDSLDRYPNIDGVVPVTHGFGCCIDTKGEGIQQLRRTVGGYVVHPNFAAVLVIGLGCEANQMDAIFMTEKVSPGARLIPLVMQEEGGTQNTVDAGIAAIEKILPEINDVKREKLPLSHLVLALQCGGSDGYSGITANPALGHAVDLLVAQGGSAILTETPEIYGAEHLLTRRAVRRDIGEKLVDIIHGWERYAEREHGSIDNNPTPGNKKGGLTTILEKSLGAVAKSGSTALKGVYKYAEPVDAQGLLFMDAPGYDPMGATGQIASGATLLAFTTGRGSCFGSRIAPTIKIATNTDMYNRMQDDMDINCGRILDGKSSVTEMGEDIFRAIMRVASGEQSKSEALNVGNEEMVPWMIGAQM
ncbi:UxaA family hydrolase [Acetobacter orleanensis]|uniref:Dehydratase n=1 Tax=Acetobacter orleanensis TaxID=104099 RepID=A0A4Y3TQF8_9PROT|nr:altronate dehydratase family protein [Acetobacter orleanensis]KXV62678.1 galactarate dehydratase [Acetobacter orleanensis]PCD79191.1 altronate dehydratase [Acetobacter orleanensis]GAN68619.1 galactarate dehydratase [Acetobacter orleanensis JCM 7639]GBR27751.1 altronate dehydratase [Acetobacter orleanensis NRIC 0473]GEB83250.1 dehydratase [Acetobacter orleanensis]